jgi:hypothetical protein
MLSSLSQCSECKFRDGEILALKFSRLPFNIRIASVRILTDHALLQAFNPRRTLTMNAQTQLQETFQ